MKYGGQGQAVRSKLFFLFLYFFVQYFCFRLFSLFQLFLKYHFFLEIIVISANKIAVSLCIENYRQK